MAWDDVPFVCKEEAMTGYASSIYASRVCLDGCLRSCCAENEFVTYAGIGIAL